MGNSVPFVFAPASSNYLHPTRITWPANILGKPDSFQRQHSRILFLHKAHAYLPGPRSRASISVTTISICTRLLAPKPFTSDILPEPDRFHCQHSPIFLFHNVHNFSSATDPKSSFLTPQRPVVDGYIHLFTYTRTLGNLASDIVGKLDLFIVNLHPFRLPPNSHISSAFRSSVLFLVPQDPASHVHTNLSRLHVRYTR